jgi:hypothetical protein
MGSDDNILSNRKILAMAGVKIYFCNHREILK